MPGDDEPSACHAVQKEFEEMSELGSLELEMDRMSTMDSVRNIRSGPMVTGSMIKFALYKIVLPVICWWTMSVMVILLIKDLISGVFPHSFALSGVCNITTGLLAWIVGGVAQRWSPPLPPVSWDESMKLCLIGFVQGVDIASSNKSLEYLSVSARTMTSSMGVLFMMVTARIWGLERLGFMRLVSAALITVGGAVQGFDHLGSAETKSEHADAYMKGLLLQFVAMTAASQKWALLQSVTQRSSPGSALAMMSKSKFPLICRTLPITGSVCILMSILFEWQTMTFESWLHQDLVPKTLVIATGIVILTISELEIVRAASAVALQVLATLHQIPVVLAGVVFFHEEVNLLSCAGFLLCMIGGLCYTRVRYVESCTATAGVPVLVEATLEEPTEMVQRGLLHT